MCNNSNIDELFNCDSDELLNCDSDSDELLNCCGGVGGVGGGGIFLGDFLRRDGGGGGGGGGGGVDGDGGIYSRFCINSFICCLVYSYHHIMAYFIFITPFPILNADLHLKKNGK